MCAEIFKGFLLASTWDYYVHYHQTLTHFLSNGRDDYNLVKIV